MDANDIELWGHQEPQEQATTLEEMDNLIEAYAKARAEYDQAKDYSSQLAKAVDALEHTIVQTLAANKRKNYSVDGIGMVSVQHRESYKVPKDTEDKKILFDYIKQKYNGETLMSMVSIHSATLNSWANQEAASGVMQIPGLGQPTVTETISFRKK